MPRLDAAPKWQKVDSLGKPIGVDKEKKVIRGYVVAQLGLFKSKGRGKFNEDSLTKITELYAQNPNGIKSRFTHPTLSSDGLGKFLGRSRDARVDGNLVRADLHLDPSSFHTPHGNLGGYVMELAESDSGALSSSLVLQYEPVYDLDEKGRKVLDEDGEPLAPLWVPKLLRASDVVDTGDAVDDFMSAGGELSLDELPDALVRRGSELLNQAFPGQARDVVQARLQAWLDRYLELRYGPAPGRSTDLLRKKLQIQERAAR
jgi:hypothetical protein